MPPIPPALPNFATASSTAAMPPTSTVLFSGVGLTIRSGPDGINMSAGEERERSGNSVSSDVGPPGEESSMDDFDDARSGTPVKDDTGEWVGSFFARNDENVQSLNFQLEKYVILLF